MHKHSGNKKVTNIVYSLINAGSEKMINHSLIAIQGVIFPTQKWNAIPYTKYLSFHYQGSRPFSWKLDKTNWYYLKLEASVNSIWSALKRLWLKIRSSSRPQIFSWHIAVSIQKTAFSGSSAALGFSYCRRAARQWFVCCTGACKSVCYIWRHWSLDFTA